MKGPTRTTRGPQRWDWQIGLTVAIMLFSLPAVVRGDQNIPSPGCNFVGDQCMYSIQLGHKGQCDSTSQTTQQGGSQCCEQTNKDVTSLRDEIELLKSQMLEIISAVNSTVENKTLLQSLADQLTSERDGLLETLRKKEKELSTTQAELSAVIRKAGDEIEALKHALGNSTDGLHKCQKAIGVPLTNFSDPRLSGGDYHLTYCSFKDSSDCQYKTLRGQVSFQLLGPSKSTLTGPKSDHSTGTPNGRYMGLDVYSLHSSYYNSGLKSAVMESPTFDPANDYCIKFWYSMRGQDVESLDVNIRVKGGVGYPVWTKSGNQAQDWRLGEIELDSEYTANPFQIDFIAKTSFYYRSGSYYNRYGNIGVDDIYVYNTTCSAIPRCPPHSVQNTVHNVTSCYTVHTEPEPWYEAYHACRSEGPNSALVSIESSEEQDFLVNMINSDPVLSMVGKDGFYTSGNDLTTEHSFKWTDTGEQRIMTYQNWHARQPNNVGGNQDCLLMEYPQDSYEWGDVDCSTAHPFICEVYYSQ